MNTCFWSGSIKVLKNKKQCAITSTFRRKQPGTFRFPSDECLFCLLVGPINSLTYKTKLVSSWKSSPPSSSSCSLKGGDVLKAGLLVTLVCFCSLFRSCNRTGSSAQHVSWNSRFHQPLQSASLAVVPRNIHLC